MNLWTSLEERFTQYGNRPAVTDEAGNAVSYGALLDSANGIAVSMLSHLDPLSRACILHTHSYFDALGVLGTLAAGCTAVPMSLNYGEANCQQILRRAEPAILLTDMDPLPESVSSAVREGGVRVLRTKELNGSGKVEPLASLSDPAFIMFTSGTTGVPKGAVLSNGNILSNLDGIAAYFRLTEEDNILIARPLYHGAVMTGEFLHALMSGSRITFYSEPFSPRRLLSFLAEKECTAMCATPTLYYHLAMNRRGVSLPYFKKAVVSGECLNPQAAAKIIEAFPGVDFYNVYGLTEASPRVCHLNPEHFAHKIGSVGVPLKNVTVRIADEDGTDVARGDIGELLVNGPNVMQGYWRDERLTAQKIVDGWLHTGDVARQDDENFLYVLGRKDHMIIRAGVNIYPQEIENALMQEDTVGEVMVWGEPDPGCGQRICAAFVPKKQGALTEAVAMNACRKRLEPYKWPNEVHIVESLPRNASGKLMRGRPAFLSIRS